jgi:hypothetical protein
MRAITSHQATNGANAQLQIRVTDEPGAGGANHRYEISGFEAYKNKSYNGDPTDPLRTAILFQNGNPHEVGVNGITHEVLLTILIDRLRCFQEGAYKCRENALALTKMEEALHWLHHRTLSRMERGVEGKSVV